MFMNEITLTGVTQFGATTAVATFLESVDPTELSPTVQVRMFGYSYNSLGAAHQINLALATTAASPVNEQITLEAAATANSFQNICGVDGILVPRRQGLQNDGAASQLLDVDLNSPNNAPPMVLIFVTVGKDNTATFRVWWDLVDVGAGH